MTFLISKPTRGGGSVIRASGELDLAAAPHLKEGLHRLIDEGERHLVLDFSGVTFIDSTTIGAVMSAMRHVREHNGSLDIICANRNVLNTFRYAGLDRLFEFHSSLDDAVHAPAAV